MEVFFIVAFILSNYSDEIGVASLVIGIISLIITCRTFAKTKLVESEIKNIKTKAITKNIFDSFRPTAIKSLEDKLEAVKSSQRLSSNMCFELIDITQNLMNYSPIFTDESLKIIKEAHEYIKALNETHSFLDTNKTYALIEYLSKIIFILNKGE